MLIVDDLLELSVKFGEIVLNAIAQTAYKVAWTDYRRQLNVTLIQLRRDFEEGRISKKRRREIEAKIFYELRLAKQILESGA